MEINLTKNQEANIAEYNKRSEKKELRKKVLALRNNLPESWRREASEAIIDKITTLPEYQQAEALFCYVSYRSEVETDALIQKALQEGKSVYCPKVIAGEHIPCMEFYRIFSVEDLETGFRGIREPIPLPARQFCISEHFVKQICTNGSSILFVMPGAVFDKNHHRIGYGGGYYDAYLKRCKQAGIKEHMLTVALAFSKQIVEKVVAEPHDIKPKLVITEEKDDKL